MVRGRLSLASEAGRSCGTGQRSRPVPGCEWCPQFEQSPPACVQQATSQYVECQGQAHSASIEVGELSLQFSCGSRLSAESRRLAFICRFNVQRRSHWPTALASGTPAAFRWGNCF